MPAGSSKCGVTALDVVGEWRNVMGPVADGMSPERLAAAVVAPRVSPGARPGQLLFEDASMSVLINRLVPSTNPPR